MASTPKVAQPAPPAQTNPTPLASPYPDDDLAGNLSQLRMGTKSNLRHRKAGTVTGAPGATGGSTPATGGSPSVPSTTTQPVTRAPSMGSYRNPRMQM